MGKRITLLLFIVFICLLAYVVFRQPPAAYYKEALPTSSPPTAATSSAVLDESTSALCHARQADPTDSQAILPDPTCTPGVVNSDVTQDNIFSTICKSGYTTTIRPPVSYTNSLKRQQIIDYGYEDISMRDYEEDHEISLELGGDPKDPKNLWPEPHGSPNEKDKVENYLHSEVCSRKMTLQVAQKEISGNWYEIYKTLP